MREILFRGRKKDGTWKQGSVHIEWGETTQNGDRNIDYRILGMNGQCDYVIPETISQYTGLTDKNGKKIFEGDIIKSCEYDDVYFVKYCADDNYPAFDVVPEINVECNGLSHLHIVEGIEVIGNIHDNPELLKGGEAE